MEYRTLGDSSLAVSAVGLGCWEFGGQAGFATDDPSRVADVVKVALDAGVNLFDTAQVYSKGASERLLAEALGPRRSDALVATKFLDVERWDRRDIIRRLEQSLRRLRTDHVDLYQMHWPKRDMGPGDGEVMYRAFEAAVRSGKARFVGVSNFRLAHLQMLAPETLALLVSNQIPYSLLWRVYEMEGLCRFCLERGIGIVAYSPLAQGLLTGRYTRQEPPGEGPVSRSKWVEQRKYVAAMKVVDELKRVAGGIDRSPAQAALNWLLGREGVASALVGTRAPDHLRGDLGALGWRLEKADADRLTEASGAFHEHIDPSWRGIWGEV